MLVDLPGAYDSVSRQLKKREETLREACVDLRCVKRVSTNWTQG